MYRIALCDDQPTELDKAKALLANYKSNHPDCAFTIHSFTTINSLTAEIAAKESFDLLLLDIYMPEKNGIEGAKEIRAYGFDGVIIFLTTSLEHSLAAFSVDATQYLVKPIDKKRFFAVLDHIFIKIHKGCRQFITLRTESGLQRVTIRDIVYVETQKHYIHIHLLKGDMLRTRMTLTNFQQELNQDFVRAGSTYLINLAFVDTLTAKNIVFTTGKIIWLPRGSYAMLRKQYFHFFRGE